jgi:hypothetical protein
MEIGEYVFGKKHGKLVHLQNLSPKIIYSSKNILRYVHVTIGYGIHYASGCALGLMGFTNNNLVDDNKYSHFYIWVEA